MTMTKSVLPKGLYIVVRPHFVDGELDRRYREIRLNYVYPEVLRYQLATQLMFGMVSWEFDGKGVERIKSFIHDPEANETVLVVEFTTTVSSQQARDIVATCLRDHLEEAYVVSRSWWWKLFVWPFSRD